MNNRLTWLRALFAVAGLYDLILGLAFLLAAPRVFARLDIPPVSHWAYVRFPAYLLVVFGIMFFAIARDPIANRNLIPFGILLKIGYAGTVFYYWTREYVSTAWKPFAFIDLVFAALFIWAYLPATPAHRRADEPAR